MYICAYKNDCKKTGAEGGAFLPFRRMYFHLFKAVTAALRLIQAGRIREAEQKLIAAQQTTEDMYLSGKSIKRE